MNTLNDALPCPFCSSTDISDGEVLMSTPNGGTSTQSMCRGCGALGPEAKLPKDEVDYGDVRSIAAWNTRANTPESSAAQGAMGDLQNEITLLRQEVEQQTIWKTEAIQHMNFLAGKLMHYVPTPAFRVSVRKYGAQPSDATAQPSVLKVIGEIVSELRVEGYYRKRCDELAVGQSMVTYANRIDAALANTAQGKPCQKFQFNPEHWDHCDFCKCSRSDHALAAKKG